MRSIITGLLLLLVLAQSSAIAQDRMDRSKAIIERPLERIISTTTASPLTPKRTPVRTAKKNGKVAPGLVAWHTDFETAQRAAANSGKPIMLFQMMGNLDEEFC